MKVGIVVAETRGSVVQDLCQLLALGEALLVMRERLKLAIQRLGCFKQDFERIAIQHVVSGYQARDESVVAGQFIAYCQTLSNCPAAFNNSSCACWRPKLASRKASHLSLTSRRAF